MGEPLKNFYGPEVPARIAGMISAVHPGFSAKEFVRDAVKGLDALELLPRGWHIARVLHRHLPPDFDEAAAILKASLGPRRAATEGDGMAPFVYLPHVFFVVEYGIGHLDTSLDLQYELTRRFSAEYSIRAFIDRYPDQTMARLRRWAKDPDVHVRRLVSEGTRPRLPWAPRLSAFQADPRPVLQLLELLKDDPELYVRRSVANNLNDIGKDHARLMLETCKRWGVNASDDRKWLIRHALRTAIKRGEPGALKLLGYGGTPKVNVERVKITPRRAVIGDSVTISFALENRARTKQALLVDFQVHFVKADKSTNAKVFKLKTLELAAGAAESLSARVSLRQMTTRKHYPGTHRVDAIVNGVAFPLGSFAVAAGTDNNG